MKPLPKEIEIVKNDMPLNRHSEKYRPQQYTFGDAYMNRKLYGREAVCLLMVTFPPCKIYKHRDSCTAYYPTDKPEKESPNLTVTEVHPVRLVCCGTDHYEYSLEWFTYCEENKSYFRIQVMIDYGTELIKIKYRYNDSRQLPKYSGFKAYPIPGLRAIMYYGDSGDYMTMFVCEVEDIEDTNFFITKGIS